MVVLNFEDTISCLLLFRAWGGRERGCRNRGRVDRGAWEADISGQGIVQRRIVQ